MVQHMEKIRSDRLAGEWVALISRRKRVAISVLRRYKASSLPWPDVMPEPADFCSWGAVKHIIELPSEVDVREESFANVVSILPQLCHMWRRRIKRELAHHYMSQ